MICAGLLLTMANPRSLYRKLQKLNTDQVIVESVQQTTGDFTEENKKQLFEGFNKVGGRLRRYGSHKYARVKNEMNPIPGLGNPDLKVTGAFYGGINTTVSGDIIKTISSDAKNDELTAKYKGIFGLGGPFKQEYVSKKLRPAFRKGIKKATGL